METQSNKWGNMFTRIAVILLLAAIVWMIPEPDNDAVLKVRHGIVALLAIVLVGKTIVDTLYFGK
jgi:hypothetical protein